MRFPKKTPSFSGLFLTVAPHPRVERCEEVGFHPLKGLFLTAHPSLPMLFMVRELRTPGC